MHGERGQDRCAQLALLDAIVFFAAAILLSSILMSFALQTDTPSTAWTERIDANEILVAFLHASVGQRFEVVLDESLSVSGSETFALCILLEASVVMNGGSAEPFQAMNDLMMDALLRLSPLGYSPSLVITDRARGLQDPIIALPEPVALSWDVHAGSAWIPSADGHELLVILMLAPASLSEVV